MNEISNNDNFSNGNQDQAFCQTAVSGSLFDFDESEQKMSIWKKVLIYLLLFPFAGSMVILSKQMRESKRRDKALKEKIRYFNPVIKEGFFSNSVTWVGREKPLTDDELDALCNCR